MVKETDNLDKRRKVFIEGARHRGRGQPTFHVKHRPPATNVSRETLTYRDTEMPHPYKDPDAQREAAPQVAEAGATLSKMMLTDIHAKVKAAFPKVVKNVWRVAKVRSAATPGEYQVAIKVPDYQPFHWQGQAVNEYHARLAAWHEFLLRQQTPGLMPVHRIEGI